MTIDGPLLKAGHDWEDSCRGPIVWDLASLVSTGRITGRASGVPADQSGSEIPAAGGWSRAWSFVGCDGSPSRFCLRFAVALA